MVKVHLEPTNVGLDLIRRLLSARESLRRAESQRNGATCDVANAENALAAWLVPKDAKVGEVYCLAVGKAFLQARMVERVLHPVGGGTATREARPVFEWRGGHPPEGPL